MTGSRRAGVLLLVASSALFLVLGQGLGRSGPMGMLDFKALYYGARCLLQNHDPYKTSEMEDVYPSQGGERPHDSAVIRKVVTFYVNLPTTFLFTSPFAMLPWGAANVLWTILTAGSFILSAFLAWDLGSNSAPIVCAVLVAFLVLNSEVLFASGNAAGLVVSLCVIAVWCFLRERHWFAGVVCLAASLLMKPHDSGFVWLYFLLAGGVFRKRALQTLALTIALGLPAVLWVSHVAPDWPQELHSNLSAISAHGGFNDPGPGSTIDRTPGMVIDLQAAISIFRNDPRFYNLVSYLVCGVLLLGWTLKTLRSPASPEGNLLALAAVSALTMLVTYHKPVDARLLILAVPACTMLWREGGRIARISLVLTSVGFIFIGDYPLAIFVMATRNLHPEKAGFFGKLLAVLVTRPATVMLLVMAVFYLWVYMRWDGGTLTSAGTRQIEGQTA